MDPRQGWGGHQRPPAHHQPPNSSSHPLAKGHQPSNLSSAVGYHPSSHQPLQPSAVGYQPSAAQGQMQGHKPLTKGRNVQPSAKVQMQGRHLVSDPSEMVVVSLTEILISGKVRIVVSADYFTFGQNQTSISTGITQEHFVGRSI